MKDWENTKERNEMIQVRVKAFGILRNLVADHCLNLEKDYSLLQLFHLMIAKYNQKFREIVVDSLTNQISSSLCILINGENIANLERKLNEGDEITLFVSVSGG